MRTHSNGSGSVASGSKGHSVGSNPFFANDHSDHSGQFKAEKKEKRILIRADGVRSDGISGSGSSKGSGSGRENNSGSNSGTNSGSNSDVNSGGNNGASHSGGSSSDGGLVAQSSQPSTSTKDTRDEVMDARRCHRPGAGMEEAAAPSKAGHHSYYSIILYYYR